MCLFKRKNKQIERHAKRNRAQNKKVKEMIHFLDCSFGENNSGMFLALVCDCLRKMMREEAPSEFLVLRTIEIKFNDCYSVKLDCDTGERAD